MSTIYKHYQNINTEYESINDGAAIEYLNYTQFDAVVTNRLFTPDSGPSQPEDLQIRVSEDIKFFVGQNDAASNDKYSLRFSESTNSALIDSQRDTLEISANSLNMNALTINDNAGALKVSTDKVLQIHSGSKIQMIGKTEFYNEVKMDKNLYIGKSLIFFDGMEPNFSNQIRIGLQYNSNKDTLDIVKQQGSGGNYKKKLMARLGQGSIFGQDKSLLDVPYYASTGISSASSFTTNASVFNAANIWRQKDKTLHWGTGTGERIGIGLSNVTNKFEVRGNSKINDVYFSTNNDISGVKNLTTSNLGAITMTTSGTTTFNGSTTLNNGMVVNAINFRDNANVNNFDGTLSTLSNDLAPWLKSSQSHISLSEFNNDKGFISKLQNVIVDSKWRFREDGENLIIEKKSLSGTWEEKFKFE